jgi:hypothetical protein
MKRDVLHIPDGYEDLMSHSSMKRGLGKLSEEQKQELTRIKERFLSDNSLGSKAGFYEEALQTMGVIEGFEMFGSQYALNKRKKQAEEHREATVGKGFLLRGKGGSAPVSSSKRTQCKRVDLLAGRINPPNT